jgi:protein phosphatase
MTLALRYAVRSDVGLLREGNEDSAYAGPRLLAIADGMGGHAAGEVASAIAISSMAPLDHDMPANELIGALAHAVADANLRLQEVVAADPATQGMGTTLTALLWSGAQVALCHIGDSRAYMLRGGDLYQISRDHTLVQSLVDEGRIRPEEVPTHPQRSLILRALDSRTDVEPDLFMREAWAGDRYLLCSDGLSDVVTAETIKRTLATIRDLDEVSVQLIELAIRGGGPDNITCIVADVVDTANTGPSPSTVPVLAGAASNGTPQELRALAHASSAAAHARLISQTAPQPAIPAEHNGSGPGIHEDADTGTGRAGRTGHRAPREHTGRRRWPIVTTVLTVLAIVVFGGGYAAWRYTQTQYYVGTNGDHVAIFRGINQKVAGISLSSLYSKTDITMSQVPSEQSAMITGTITASSLTKAQAVVSNIRSAVDMCKSQYAAQHTWLLAKQHYDQLALQYQQAVHEATVKHTKKPTAPNIKNPGNEPTAGADCQPATAFGIQVPATASASPSASSSVSASPSPGRTS